MKEGFRPNLLFCTAIIMHKTPIEEEAKLPGRQMTGPEEQEDCLAATEQSQEDVISMTSAKLRLHEEDQLRAECWNRGNIKKFYKVDEEQRKLKSCKKLRRTT
jgi:hypothetical protein